MFISLSKESTLSMLDMLIKATNYEEIRYSDFSYVIDKEYAIKIEEDLPYYSVNYHNWISFKRDEGQDGF